MIEVKNLTKHYGINKAVDNLSFTVENGEILGFLGPNGAGKSTTMNIITGYLSSNEGTVKIDNIDIFDDPIKAKKKIGYLPEQPPLYLDMTVEAYLNFIYELKGSKLPKKAHIAEICHLVKITDVYKRVIKNLSKGYKQRVGIAQALIGNPPVLILDEPTVGLDPKQIIDIRNLIKALGKNHTIILSSHILSEVQAVCERVIVINKGMLIANDTPENLSKNLSIDHRLILRTTGPSKEVVSVIQKIPNVKSVVILGQKEQGTCDFELEAKENTDIRYDLFERISSRGWVMLGLRSTELTLEDIFLKLTNNDSKNQLKGGKKR